MTEIIIGEPHKMDKSKPEWFGHILIGDVFIPYTLLEHFGHYEVRFNKTGIELNYQRALPSFDKPIRDLVLEAANYLFGDK